jgi:small subunit ribosomal protein S6
MPFYEHVYIARQDATPQAVEDLTAQIKATLEANGGKLVGQEQWGVRTLAYRIKKNRKGHYVLLNVDAPSAAMQEVERLQKINEDILRFITIRVDAFEDGPSAMMKVRDRDDRRRGEFGDGGFGGGGFGGGGGRDRDRGFGGGGGGFGGRDRDDRGPRPPRDAAPAEGAN